MAKATSQKTRAIDLRVSKDHLQVLLADGRIVLVPLAWYPKLEHASRKEILHYEWIGNGLGIHWPDIDEDLAVEGFLLGLHAPANQFKRKRSAAPRFLTEKRIQDALRNSASKRRVAL
jgi:hypothetical protein